MCDRQKVLRLFRGKQMRIQELEKENSTLMHLIRNASTSSSSRQPSKKQKFSENDVSRVSPTTTTELKWTGPAQVVHSTATSQQIQSDSLPSHFPSSVQSSEKQLPPQQSQNELTKRTMLQQVHINSSHSVQEHATSQNTQASFQLSHPSSHIQPLHQNTALKQQEQTVGPPHWHYHSSQSFPPHGNFAHPYPTMYSNLQVTHQLRTGMNPQQYQRPSPVMHFNVSQEIQSNVYSQSNSFQQHYYQKYPHLRYSDSHSPHYLSFPHHPQAHNSFTNVQAQQQILAQNMQSAYHYQKPTYNQMYLPSPPVHRHLTPPAPRPYENHYQPPNEIQPAPSQVDNSQVGRKRSQRLYQNYHQPQNKIQIAAREVDNSPVVPLPSQTNHCQPLNELHPAPKEVDNSLVDPLPSRKPYQNHCQPPNEIQPAPSQVSVRNQQKDALQTQQEIAHHQSHQNLLKDGIWHQYTHYSGYQTIHQSHIQSFKQHHQSEDYSMHAYDTLSSSMKVDDVNKKTSPQSCNEIDHSANAHLTYNQKHQRKQMLDTEILTNGTGENAHCEWNTSNLSHVSGQSSRKQSDFHGLTSSSLLDLQQSVPEKSECIITHENKRNISSDTVPFTSLKNARSENQSGFADSSKTFRIPGSPSEKVTSSKNCSLPQILTPPLTPPTTKCSNPSVIDLNSNVNSTEVLPVAHLNPFPSSHNSSSFKNNLPTREQPLALHAPNSEERSVNLQKHSSPAQNSKLSEIGSDVHVNISSKILTSFKEVTPLVHDPKVIPLHYSSSGVNDMPKKQSPSQNSLSQNTETSASVSSYPMQSNMSFKDSEELSCFSIQHNTAKEHSKPNMALKKRNKFSTKSKQRVLEKLFSVDGNIPIRFNYLPKITDEEATNISSNIEIFCYVCKSLVRGGEILLHLFFGKLQCTSCDYTIENCSKLKGMNDKEILCFNRISQVHDFSIWKSNPVDFLYFKLWKHFHSKTKRTSSEHNVSNFFNYLETLMPLREVKPWNSAIARCLKYKNYISKLCKLNLNMFSEYKEAKEITFNEGEVNSPSKASDDDIVSGEDAVVSASKASENIITSSASKHQRKEEQVNMKGSLKESVFNKVDSQNFEGASQISVLSGSESLQNVHEDSHMTSISAAILQHEKSQLQLCSSQIEKENRIEKVAKSDRLETVSALKSTSVVTLSQNSLKMGLDSIKEETMELDESDNTLSEFLVKSSCTFELLDRFTEYIQVSDQRVEPEIDIADVQEVSKYKHASETSPTLSETLNNNDDSGHLIKVKGFSEKVKNKLDLDNNSEKNIMQDISDVPQNIEKLSNMQVDESVAPDSSSSDENHLVINLALDRKHSNEDPQNKYPEECPMCYAVLCPTRFSVNINNFSTNTVCNDCGLIITVKFMDEDDASNDNKDGNCRSYKRPGPKSKTIEHKLQKDSYVKNKAEAHKNQLSEDGKNRRHTESETIFLGKG